VTPHEVLVDLAACLCASLTPEGQDDSGMCFCGILPGDNVAIDYIDDCETCGMAWVRLQRAYPAAGLGVAATDATNCNTPLGLDIEIGVVRCVPAGVNGEAPRPEELLESAEQMNADLLAIRRAISCCGEIDVDYSVGEYAPVGPEGAVLGWLVTIYAVI
jgi:hypothetical protein